jgi:hypothetical protein
MTSDTWKRTCVSCALHASQQLNQNHKFDHPLPLPHDDLRRSSASMDFRKSFLKPFKKVKQRLAEGGHKQGRSGSENDQKGREADVERRRVSQQSSHRHSEGGDLESRPSREGKDVDGKEVGRIDPPTSTHSKEPNCM